MGHIGSVFGLWDCSGAHRTCCGAHRVCLGCMGLQWGTQDVLWGVLGHRHRAVRGCVGRYGGSMGRAVSVWGCAAPIPPPLTAAPRSAGAPTQRSGVTRCCAKNTAQCAWGRRCGALWGAGGGWGGVGGRGSFCGSVCLGTGERRDLGSPRGTCGVSPIAPYL